MAKLKPVKELFVLPTENGSFLLYAPLNRCVAEVNSATVSALKSAAREGVDSETHPQLQPLVECGILDEEKKTPSSTCENGRKREYLPTSVTLMPTYKCNLRCVYCYANAGLDAEKDLEWNVAKAAIDLVINNAVKLKTKHASLGFHGGGEPLLACVLPIVKMSVAYFRDACAKHELKGQVNSATNGVFSQETLEWVAENIGHLNISLDGPEVIQNTQRPKAGGQPSFDAVVRTVKYLEEHKKDYGLRATITRESVFYMSDIVRFFKQISSNKSFHLEPLAETGRCFTTGAKAPSSSDFVKYAIEARKVGEELGVGVDYSACRLHEFTTAFCGAVGRNFFVVPTGDVTSCLEVCRKSDPRSNVFFIGTYDANDGFVFDKEKIARLSERTIDKMPYCADCIAKFTCAGDCLAKVYSASGGLYDTRNNKRCGINQDLMVYEIKLLASRRNHDNKQLTA
ncbi:radical SAM protein [Candidatus Woesearchaeota archaeon]|nr:radical SAM protein [Candidatus Woesearchaeota archaeon]